MTYACWLAPLQIHGFRSWPEPQSCPVIHLLILGQFLFLSLLWRPYAALPTIFKVTTSLYILIHNIPFWVDRSYLALPSSIFINPFIGLINVFTIAISEKMPLLLFKITPSHSPYSTFPSFLECSSIVPSTSFFPLFLSFTQKRNTKLFTQSTLLTLCSLNLLTVSSFSF